MNRPARIGLVIGQLSVGGAEGQLAELVRGMDRSVFEPIVYVLADSSTAVSGAPSLDGAVLRVVGAVGPARALRLGRALAADGIDLVHSWLFIANTYAWAARSVGGRRPLVTSARNCKTQGWLHSAANVAAFRASAAIVVNARLVGAYITRRYRAPTERIRVVYNGVDTERFRPGVGNADRPATVLTAGRLVEQKDPWLFLDAAVELVRRIPDVRFIVVGEGPLRARLRERAERMGLGGRVEFTGEQRAMEEWYGEADVFWLTSRWEGLPNVVLEAMASGVPVVATDVGGVRELIGEGGAGFLATPGAVETFVSPTVRLCADPALRGRVGALARTRAEEFSIKRMVEAMTGVYTEVLGATAGARA